MVILLLELFCSLAVWLHLHMENFCDSVFMLLWKDKGFKKDEEERSMICRRNVHRVLVCLSITKSITKFRALLEFGPNSP